jgi:protein arginine kinase
MRRLLTENGPWFTKTGPEGDVVLASRVRLARNLIEYPFPDTLSRDQERKVRDRLAGAFAKLPERWNFTILYLKDLSPLEKRLLLERNIVSRAFSLAQEKALVLDDSQRLSALFNEQDHLKLSSVREGLALQEAFREADELDSQLEESLPFACNLEWGYLNSSFLDLGTGMRASLMFHLPGLVSAGLIDGALKVIAQVGLSVKGFFSRRKSSLGDIYQISNQISLGLSEEEILENLAGVAKPLIDYERKAREQLLEQRRIELEDKVFRAWGILSSCRSIGAREASTLLSRLRLGINLGLISEVPLETATSLFFFSQKSHVQAASDAAMDEAAINIHRASMIRERIATNLGGCNV